MRLVGSTTGRRTGVKVIRIEVDVEATERELVKRVIAEERKPPRRRPNLCPSCGLSLNNAEICPHHHCVHGDDWASANKIWCDYFHRKKEIERIPLDADDF